MAGVNGEDDNPQASETLHPGGTALQGPKGLQRGGLQGDGECLVQRYQQLILRERL